MAEKQYIDQVLEKHIDKEVSIYFYKPDGEEDRAQGYLSAYSQSFIELVNRKEIGYDEAFKTL